MGKLSGEPVTPHYLKSTILVLIYKDKITPVDCKFKAANKYQLEGSGSGSVGRAVTSYTRGPGFKSSHWQNLLNICLLSTVY